MTRRAFKLAFALGMILAVPAPFAFTSEARAVAQAPQTPDNLRRAHDLAQKGATMFAAFAAKADEEGYRGVASLMRAAARAQQAHVTSLLKVMNAADIKPQNFETPAIPAVKSTKENLDTVLEWTTRARTEDLPKAIAAARAEGERGAETAMNYARQSLTEIARFTRGLQSQLESTRAAKKEYFVDRTCGYVVDKLDFQKCPVCLSTRDGFEKVD